jgi:hypothetical protein
MSLGNVGKVNWKDTNPRKIEEGRGKICTEMFV